MNGGYDEGYHACPCFWGDKPGSLVAELLAERDVAGWHVLDLGCGEGKNAAALAQAGAHVIAIDCSEIAIARGKENFGSLRINWLVDDAAKFPVRPGGYDLVVMYGLPHCLPNSEHISALIDQASAATRCSGVHLLVAFNDRDQDLERAHPGFKPTLVSHKFYVDAYACHRIVRATDATLRETHPHNGIIHHHSMTRLVAEIR